MRPSHALSAAPSCLRSWSRTRPYRSGLDLILRPAAGLPHRTRTKVTTGWRSAVPFTPVSYCLSPVFRPWRRPSTSKILRIPFRDLRVLELERKTLYSNPDWDTHPRPRLTGSYRGEEPICIPGGRSSIVWSGLTPVFTFGSDRGDSRGLRVQGSFQTEPVPCPTPTPGGNSDPIPLQLGRGERGGGSGIR